MIYGSFVPKWDCWDWELAKMYGGLGQGVVMEQLVMEEIAKECPVLALIIDAHLLSYRMLNHVGTKEQKEKYIPLLATGEYIAALAGTEPAGSTNYPEYVNMGRKDGDDLIVNTTKVFITNSHVADVYVVYGLVDGAPQAVIVEKAGQLEHKLGMAGSNTGTVRCNNVRVPKENICRQDAGLDLDFATTYLNISAISLGLAEGVFEKTKTYVLNRSRYGKSLGSFQVVAHHIAKMATDIELARIVSRRKTA
jgi:hypothetical protein